MSTVIKSDILSPSRPVLPGETVNLARQWPDGLVLRLHEADTSVVYDLLLVKTSVATYNSRRGLLEQVLVGPRGGSLVGCDMFWGAIQEELRLGAPFGVFERSSLSRGLDDVVLRKSSFSIKKVEAAYVDW